MLAQYFAECRVQQVGSRVIGCTGSTFFGIYASHHRSFRMCGQFLGDMYRKVIFLLCINYFNRFEFADQYTCITYLTTAFGIERGIVQYNLIQCLVFLFYLTVTKDTCFIFRIVVTNKFSSSFFQCNPVAGFYGSGIAGTLLLLLHLGIEFLDVGSHTVFTENQFRQVERETESII